MQKLRINDKVTTSDQASLIWGNLAFRSFSDIKAFKQWNSELLGNISFIVFNVPFQY